MMTIYHSKPIAIHSTSQSAPKFGIRSLASTDIEFKKPQERSGIYSLLAEPKIQEISDDWLLMAFKGQKVGKDTFKLVNAYERVEYEGSFSSQRLVDNRYRAYLTKKILTVVQPWESKPEAEPLRGAKGKLKVLDFTTPQKKHRPTFSLDA
ncbi:MAG TPA: hypothetical protein V6C52_02485 [Coleofasciculaceae cyanobacterium]|jgi:hypothetical protein